MSPEDGNGSEILKLINESPFYKYMQMKIVEAGDGRSELTLDTTDNLKNLYGILHGGAVGTIMDSCGGVAVGSLLEEGEICVTVDMRVNYIANVRGGQLVGKGRALHRGKKTGVAESEVRDENGNLIAVGMSTHLIMKPGSADAS